MEIKRGDVFLCDLDGGVGTEQRGIRPVLVIQNDMGNRHSQSTIIAPITSSTTKANLPTHVVVNDDTLPLRPNSMVLLEQIRTIDKGRCIKYICSLDGYTMNKVNVALAISVGLR